jgi:hypothetical protein
MNVEPACLHTPHMLNHEDSCVVRVVAEHQNWLAHLPADPELVESSRH